ncbi:unnamed protein product [Linum tenue]|uniref:PAR1 protein n=1 Tax=Linum tenue TaxID=586396 RepID=A0AAV0PXH7_9ROSI|nr:unnamed protein product [Linum tenue]
MAASLLKMIAFFTLSSLLILNGALGDMMCEELPVELCAYSISDAGKRCVLENYLARKRMVKYQCKTSEVVMETMSGWIETEACINDCGLDRKAVGISSDYLLSPNFVAKLCSQPCFSYCPNILDLYSNLAQAEGMNLHDICNTGNGAPRRILYNQPKSSSAAIDGGAMGTAEEGNGAIGAPVGSPLFSPAFTFADDGTTVAAIAPSPDTF